MTAVVVPISQHAGSRIAGGSLLPIVLCSLASHDLVVGDPGGMVAKVTANVAAHVTGFLPDALVALWLLVKRADVGLRPSMPA